MSLLKGYLLIILLVLTNGAAAKYTRPSFTIPVIRPASSVKVAPVPNMFNIMLQMRILEALVLQLFEDYPELVLNNAFEDDWFLETKVFSVEVTTEKSPNSYLLSLKDYAHDNEFTINIPRI